jgi:hypothetical protein
MLRWLAWVMMALGTVAVGAQETAVRVRQLMTVEEFKAAGLDKLSPTELRMLDRWVTKHTVDAERLAQARTERLAQGREASSGLPGYPVEAVANDKTFIINGSAYKATTQCVGFTKGDRVIFAEGSEVGACASAKFVSLRNGEVCDASCE